MPTILPPRHEPQPPRPDGDENVRQLVIAGTVLLSVLTLVCEQMFGPTLGYSLAQYHGDLQLSP